MFFILLFDIHYSAQYYWQKLILMHFQPLFAPQRERLFINRTNCKPATYKEYYSDQGHVVDSIVTPAPV